MCNYFCLYELHSYIKAVPVFNPYNYMYEVRCIFTSVADLLTLSVSVLASFSFIRSVQPFVLCLNMSMGSSSLFFEWIWLWIYMYIFVHCTFLCVCVCFVLFLFVCLFVFPIGLFSIWKVSCNQTGPSVPGMCINFNTFKACFFFLAVVSCRWLLSQFSKDLCCLLHTLLSPWYSLITYPLCL